ncbi:MAG: hypothetical protein J0H92_21125, partial [Sphingobacteriales bacterium]|nr:hypothetical protein [Sphingobacteriales bacterium]
MIATNNYFKEIEKIDFSELPEAFRKGHEFLEKATDRGNNWTSYQSSDTIKKTIDIYLAKLNEFVSNNKKADNKQRKKIRQQQSSREIIQEALIKQSIVNPDGSSKKKARQSASKENEVQPTLVERIPEELRFIKRFVNL